MKKVLFLIHTLGGGGAEKVLVNLANEMDKKKYDVTVMTVIDTGIFRKDLNSDVTYKTMFKIPFKLKEKKAKETNEAKSGSLLAKSDWKTQFLARSYTMMWRIIPQKLVYRLFIREKYDTEVAYLEGICAKIISGSNQKNSKKLAWIHVDLKNHPKSSKVFSSFDSEKKCYEKFDQIVCVSETVKSQFIDKFSYDSNKVIVKYNPINQFEIKEKSQVLIKDELQKQKYTLCSIGRLINQKGYDRLLRVHKRLIEEGYDYHLWIIGEGNKRPNLELFIKENNLEGSVKLLGFKENPYQYLQLADAFVCSSRAEGFSTVACEALILEKPIVTVDCSGMKELLGTDNEYGIVTKNDEDSLFEGLKDFLGNEDKKAFYKERAKQRSNIFVLEQLVKEIEKLC